MILVIDFGSQYTQLLARRIREFSVRSEIVPYFQAEKAIRDQLAEGHLQGIIFSGGPNSVYETDVPTVSKELLTLGVPVLGVCYGLQLINTLLGGSVRSASVREYGPEAILVADTLPAHHPLGALKRRDNPSESCRVWMSHGDEIDAPAPGLVIDARSTKGAVASFHHENLPIFGLQFHPEVEHTSYGREILFEFVTTVCGASRDWNPESIVETSIKNIRSQVSQAGPDAQVICGLSGGVDSTVAAVLCHHAIGARQHCIFIDNGLLREGEFDEVLTRCRSTLNLNIRGVDASQLFLSRLAGVTDPEQKRKIIGHTFIEVFEAEARKIPNAKFLVQGTLYTDVIESVPLRGTSVTIKSHHNVGGLPERMALDLIEPLRELFKDEVRAVGRSLVIPHESLRRHPFPGPGLAIRIPGAITPDKLKTLREADTILIDELNKSGLYEKVWQAFAVLLPVQSVGVMGDGRTYENVCAIRVVDATDGMTAHWSHLPYDFLERLSTRIINQVRGINRVVYDISSKPPATIEWE